MSPARWKGSSIVHQPGRVFRFLTTDCLAASAGDVKPSFCPGQVLSVQFFRRLLSTDFSTLPPKPSTSEHHRKCSKVLVYVALVLARSCSLTFPTGLSRPGVAGSSPVRSDNTFNYLRVNVNPQIESHFSPPVTLRRILVLHSGFLRLWGIRCLPSRYATACLVLQRCPDTWTLVDAPAAR